MPQKVINDTTKSVKKYKRIGLVAIKVGEKIVAPMEYDGAMDNLFLKHDLIIVFLSVVKKGTVIVMDNASTSSQKQLVCVAQKAGSFLIFLPPYSPQFNPIEKFWS